MRPSLQTSLRFTVTALAVLSAVWAGRWLWHHYQEEPWTRDGRVRADVRQVAPEVSGAVHSVEVRDNQDVVRGQVLFVLDRARFELVLARAEAEVALRRAQVARAQSEAERQRPAPLDPLQNPAMEEARAELARAGAERDLAALELERTTVRSPANGTVVNLLLQPGDQATAGRPLVAIVDRESFRVEGYFEETKLSRIHVGDPATIRLMGEDAQLRGRVVGIAAGIEDRDRTSGPSMLPDVNPTFSWVRLAQRVPVRIALDEVPRGMRLVSGRTATVEVHPRSTEATRDVAD